MKVLLRDDDLDWHGLGCGCGVCNAVGRSLGIGIYPLPDAGEVLERVYGPSYEAALHHARLLCQQRGWEVRDGASD